VLVLSVEFWTSRLYAFLPIIYLSFSGTYIDGIMGGDNFMEEQEHMGAIRAKYCIYHEYDRFTCYSRDSSLGDIVMCCRETSPILPTQQVAVQPRLLA
jgi:hypothetical protein